jgi:hypothetical protein
MKVRIEVLAEDSAEANHTDAQLDEILRLVAGNPKTSHEILNAVSKQTSPSVLQEVAQNPHTDLETLDDLLHDPRPQVRAALTSHPSLINFVWKLVADTSPLVRYRVAKTQGLPEHVYEALLHDSDLNVRRRAEFSLNTLRQAENVLVWLSDVFSGRRKAS